MRLLEDSLLVTGVTIVVFPAKPVTLSEFTKAPTTFGRLRLIVALSPILAWRIEHASGAPKDHGARVVVGSLCQPVGLDEGFN